MVILADAGEPMMTAYCDEVAPRLEPVVLVSVVSVVTVNDPATAASM
jgi:hypothetical protein